MEEKKHGVIECAWCGEEIYPHQPSCKDVDGDLVHIHCAAEELDEIYFDSDMGFGSD